MIDFIGRHSGDQAILTQVNVKDTRTGKASEPILVDAAFVAIGHAPNTGMLKEKDSNVALTMDSHGYLITQSGSMATSMPGIFAAGDVADSVYRQAVTSAGTGAMAALDAERWLSKQGLA